jgi:hypothetical protein
MFSGCFISVFHLGNFIGVSFGVGQNQNIFFCCGIGEASAWNKQSTVSTGNQMLEVIPEKREKGDGGYVYCL